MGIFKKLFEDTVITAVATYISAGKIFADHALDYVYSAEMSRATRRHFDKMADDEFFEQQRIIAQLKGIEAASRFDSAYWNPLALRYLVQTQFEEAVEEAKNRGVTFLVRREFIGL